MVGAGRWAVWESVLPTGPGSLAALGGALHSTAVSPTPGSSLRCSSLSTHPPTFPARWDCQGPRMKRLRVLPFLLNFLGPPGPALNMEGHEAQHASTAAHTLGYATRSSGT